MGTRVESSALTGSVVVNGWSVDGSGCVRRVDWLCVGLGRVAGHEVLSGFVVAHGRSVVGSGCTCRVDWLCVFAPVALYLVKSLGREYQREMLLFVLPVGLGVLSLAFPVFV